MDEGYASRDIEMSGPGDGSIRSFPLILHVLVLRYLVPITHALPYAAFNLASDRFL